MNACQTRRALWPALLAFLLGPAGLGCAQEEQGKAPRASHDSSREVAPGVRLVGTLAHPRLTESSGVVASRQYPGILWTHNDGGGGRKQTLYAIERHGRTVGEFLIPEVLLQDWEDIAIDDQNFLYVGDIGNNESQRRELAVYRVAEPNPTSTVAVVQVKASWRLRFPGNPFDCESLFVWNGRGYVVSKVLKDARAQIFGFPLDNRREPVILEWVATTKIESPVTGADISPDGKWLALVAKSGAFLYRIDGDPARAGKGKPFQTKFRNSHVEGCTFVPDGLLATAENREIFLFTDPAFRGAQQVGRDSVEP